MSKIKNLKEIIQITSQEYKNAEKDLIRINELYDEYKDLSNMQIQAVTRTFKERLTKGETLDDIKCEAFALAREAVSRTSRKRLYDVQILGALILHQGSIAEMKTGEGKTLTSIPAVYLNALSGQSTIISTVNEYLAQRDAEETGKAYKMLGLTVGVNLNAMSPTQKREAYCKDVVYSTHSELGFDYLKDNMVDDISEKVQRPYYFCLIDEVDSILIDEAKTPLIIAGGEDDQSTIYKQVDQFVKKLKPSEIEVDWESKGIQLTPKSIDKANAFFNIDNLFKIEHSDLVHRIHNALRANIMMQKDVDYIVMDDKIHLIDIFTGRVMEGRSYSSGLQQAIQAKEKVTIEPETKVLATITFQNYFRMFKKLCGMTGTAKTEENEFIDIYNIRVHSIPTNKPIKRIDHEDQIFYDTRTKYEAIINKVKELYDKGQPVLLGTEEVRESVILSNILEDAGIKHQVLNAKQDKKEADIIAKAGEFKTVTIATNMAGRGTDIKLTKESIAAGGLFVIGTNKAESRRIDNQLKGRSGRQGDVGESQFFISLEDTLVKRFARQDKLLKKYASHKGENIPKKSVITAINKAQVRVEGLNFEARKSLLHFDDVIRQQRELIYAQRDIIISSATTKETMIGMLKFVSTEVLKLKEMLDLKGYVDPKKLSTFVNDTWLSNSQLRLKEEEVINKNNSEISELILNLLLQNYNEISAKIVKNMAQEFFNRIEKEILLTTLDKHWQFHIDNMTKLKSKIDLTQHAQKNPYQEYLEEGNMIFNEMKSVLSFEVVRRMMQNKFTVLVKAHALTPEEIEKNIQEAVKSVFPRGAKIELVSGEKYSQTTEIMSNHPDLHPESIDKTHIDVEPELDKTDKK